MSVCTQDWFLTRAFDFVDIGYTFAGFGNIIIDADSLLSFVNADFQSDLDTCLKKFFTNLTECNLEEYRIVFFTKKSNRLNFVQNFVRLGIKIYLISDWNDNQWTHLLNEINISLFLISKLNIFNEIGAQYDLIHHICTKNRIQTAIIDDIKFHNMNVFSSIILSERAIDVSFEKFRPLTQESNIIISESGMHLTKIYNIKNKSVSDLLDYSHNDSNNNPIPVATIEFTKFDNKFEWDLKIHYKPGLNSNSSNTLSNEDFKKNLNQNQKYYRYMEVYASSLNSSKNLHHRIVNQIDESSRSKASLKSTQKIQDLINKNTEAKNLAKETKELELLKRVKISCYNDIEKNLFAVNTEQFSPNSMLELRRLKIKWLNYEPIGTEKKINTLILLDQLYDDSFEKLEELEVFNLLNSLKSQGLESLSLFYAQHILSKKNCEKIKNFCQNLKSTFNHDALFQLKYYGQYLPRTLDSIDDPRVCFKPDKWQKNLLDIVDQNESALICNLLSK